MPLIQMHILEGRTAETKRQLISEVTDAVSRTLGAKPESIRVLLYELPKEHWAVGGVTMAERQQANTNDAKAAVGDSLPSDPHQGNGDV
ncbi:4-oxalocrotonate tautomerase family protein [Alicyclobacillus tolerans]|uniref:2-hydroxymuconate tautomerase n=1 Tax=Alicyclobacillus tolerans TaxID=90970 RepID=UPI001F207D34|nr:2-hydroxymuconate tautomerase [Alicyclobacillus tolerans]MCF8563191.1 4-oxalocrotonate tautomerase family protein [Alicyclobacillus tolerans]